MQRRVVVPLSATAVALAGKLLAGAIRAHAAAPAASSCVACHTDVEKLKEEAKGIPQAAGSALQSGKG